MAEAVTRLTDCLSLSRHYEEGTAEVDDMLFSLSEIKHSLLVDSNRLVVAPTLSD